MWIDFGIVILVLAGLGGFLAFLRRRYGQGYAGDGWQWLDQLRDFWHSLSDRADASPAPAMAGPATAPRTAPSARPAAPDPGQAGPAPARPPMPPPPAALPPAAAEAPPGAPSAGGAQSDILYAISALVAEASHGDIKACRRVLETFAVMFGGFDGGGAGSALVGLGTRLSEPDKRYGPEIWEPVMQAGASISAAGIKLGEATANLVSLINTTVGQLADSPRQAPHHSQMEGGA
jgi:hypothetical protein